MAELTGESRATANGVLATSNQLGATIVASVEASFSRLEDSRVPGGHDHSSGTRSEASTRGRPSGGGRCCFSGSRRRAAIFRRISSDGESTLAQLYRREQSIPSVA